MTPSAMILPSSLSTYFSNCAQEGSDAVRRVHRAPRAPDSTCLWAHQGRRAIRLSRRASALVAGIFGVIEIDRRVDAPVAHA